MSLAPGLARHVNAGVLRASVSRLSHQYCVILPVLASFACFLLETLLHYCSAAMALLPNDVFMALDVGLVHEADTHRRGYIDCYIHGPGSRGIGIELTREGKALTEHSARTDAKTGAFAAMQLISWVTVDIRRTKPRTKGKADTVFVVLDKDFRRATIMQQRQKDEHVLLMQ